jgi:hypothetical protein
MSDASSTGHLAISARSRIMSHGSEDSGRSRCSSAAEPSVYRSENSGLPVTARSTSAHTAGATAASATARTRPAHGSGHPIQTA